MIYKKGITQACTWTQYLWKEKVVVTNGSWRGVVPGGFTYECYQYWKFFKEILKTTKQKVKKNSRLILCSKAFYFLNHFPSLPPSFCVEMAITQEDQQHVTRKLVITSSYILQQLHWHLCNMNCKPYSCPIYKVGSWFQSPVHLLTGFLQSILLAKAKCNSSWIPVRKARDSMSKQVL